MLSGFCAATGESYGTHSIWRGGMLREARRGRVRTTGFACLTCFTCLTDL